MADTKKTQLSITIAAIDKATGPIRAVNERLAKMTAPIRSVTDKLASGFKSAFGGIMAGVAKVGSAIGSLISQLPLIGGVLVAAAGAAVAGILHLAKGFDALGKRATELGVGVDFLAAMRFGADHAGLSVEQLDGGMQTFAKGLGQARAGTGRMVTALGHMSPALLKQLKAAKSNEEAVYLLSDAMAKLQDPAKKAALAAATFGDAADAPFLSQGAKGLKEVSDRFLHLAGSQKEAAEKAAAVDDAMTDLHASTDGFKAALVTGLAPALTKIIGKMAEWLSGHREEFAKMIANFGEKLPRAIERVIGKVKAFVDQIVRLYDRFDAFIHLEELQEKNAQRDQRVAFYKRQNKDKSLTGSDLEQAAQVAVQDENQLQERLKAQAAGVDWTQEGDTAKYGNLGRKSVYSAAELAALQKQWGAGSSRSLGLENSGLIGQAMSERADVTQKAVEAMRTSNAELAHIITSTVAATKSEVKVTIEHKNVPHGTRAKTESTGPAQVDTSLGYQLNPGTY